MCCTVGVCVGGKWCLARLLQKFSLQMLVRSYSHTDGVCHCFSARNKQLLICDVASFRSPPSPRHQHVQVNAVSRTDG